MLTFGAVNDDVRELQRLLNVRGWRDGAGEPLDVDGDFGPCTLQAVLWFQAQAGLEVDGIVGPITWAALRDDSDHDAGEVPDAPPATSEWMGQRALGVAIIYHSKDVRERPAGSNRGGPAQGVDARFSVNAIQRQWFTRAGQPWCAMFCAVCCDEAGVWRPQSGAPAVVNWVGWAQANGFLHAAPGFIPQPGDLFTVGSSTHIGFVESYDASNRRICTIEGNSGDRVRSQWRPRSGGKGGERSGGGISWYIRLPQVA